uniref:Uncharacterized protein n=1 Tax=Vitis vinifera TaxID=29760 RepID=F6I2T5_VITVI
MQRKAKDTATAWFKERR